MNNEGKIKVLVVSLEAGGGHRAIKDSFVRSLTGKSNLIVKEYHSDTKFFDISYKLLLKYLPFVFTELYKLGTFTLIFLDFLKHIETSNAKRALEKFHPDVIISTHYIYGIIFKNLKRKKRNKYVLISAITDYGLQKAEMHLYNKPDFYLALDDWSKEEASQFFPKENIYTYGVSVNPVFIEVSKLNSTILESEFNKMFLKYFPKSSFDSSRQSVLFIGGSGWTRKSEDLIFDLINQDKYNVFVSCGKDKNWYEKLTGIKNTYPFGFIDQKELAYLERFVDLAVMTSFGTGSLHEIMEVGKYPLFVNNHIKAQESENIKLIKKYDLGIYEEDMDLMIQHITDYLKAPEKYSTMYNNCKNFRKNEKLMVRNNYNVIREIYEKSKVEENRLK